MTQDGTKKRYRVFCTAVSRDYRDQRTGEYHDSFCPWGSGYRTAASKEDAEAKPCPICGGPVDAHEMRGK